MSLEQLIETLNQNEYSYAFSVFNSAQNPFSISNPASLNELFEAVEENFVNFANFSDLNDHFSLLSVANLIIKTATRFGKIDLGIKIFNYLLDPVDLLHYEDRIWKQCVSNFFNFSGQLFGYSGQTAKSIRLFEQSLAIRQQLGNEEKIAGVLNNLGLAHQNTGEFSKAAQMYDRALRIFKEMMLEKKVVAILNNLAYLTFTMGEFTQSMKYSMEGIKLLDDHDLPPFEMALRTNLANVYSLRGETDLALAHYNYVSDLAASIDDNYFLILSYRNLGNLFMVRNEYNKALNHFQKALKNPHIDQFQDELAGIYHLIIASHVELKQPELSNPYLELLNAMPIASDSKKIKQLQKISFAYILKSSARLKDRILAQMEFKKIVEDVVIDYQLTLTAMIELTIMLVFEFKTSPNAQVMVELDELLDQLDKLINNQTMKPIRIQIMILKSIFFIIKGDIRSSVELLNTTKQLATDLGFMKLSFLASNYIDYLLPSTYSIVKTTPQLTLDEHTLAELEGMVINLKQVGSVNLQFDIPSYITLVIYKKGRISVLPKNTFDPGSHMEFIQIIENLDHTLENDSFKTLSYTDHSTLIYKGQQMILCLLFKGSIFSTNQKFRVLVSLIKQNKILWDHLNRIEDPSDKYENAISTLSQIFSAVFQFDENHTELIRSVDTLSLDKHLRIDNEFKILLHPFRFELLYVLYDYYQVSRKEIMSIMNTNSGTLDRHLKILIELELIKTKYEILDQKAVRFIMITPKGYSLFDNFRKLI